MRHWLLTNTTYGTWLPGDGRRSVLRSRGQSQLINAEPRLARHARSLQKHPTVLLNVAHAEVLLRQFQETAQTRHWRLLAVAILANHFHLVVAVDDDPDPRKMLVDFKAYGSRALHRNFSCPEGGTWWTKGGSKRRLAGDGAVAGAVNYVLHKQKHPLLVWEPEGAGG